MTRKNHLYPAKIEVRYSWTLVKSQPALSPTLPCYKQKGIFKRHAWVSLGWTINIRQVSQGQMVALVTRSGGSFPRPSQCRELLGTVLAEPQDSLRMSTGPT